MDNDTVPTITGAMVVEYLRNHPNFLDLHPEVMGFLQNKSTSDGKVISFTERKTEFLRRRVDELEKKMLELVQFGTENDELLTKYHAMALRLIQADTLSNVFQTVYRGLNEEFNLPYAAIRVWFDNTTLQVGPEFEEVSDLLKRAIEQMNTPFVDKFASLPYHESFAEWLWEEPIKIGSAAVAPLRQEGQTFGVLLMASPDSTRFSRQMGAVYLNQMIDQIAAAIIRNK